MAMNLGEELLHEVPSNRAEVVHSSSQRSIAASDDFHSLSERGVSPASSDEATTVIRHNSPEAARHPVSPLLPTRENTPPQPVHPAAQDQSSEIFYPSRSTPSPAPVNGLHEDVSSPARAPSIRHVSEEPGSGTVTPRPVTIVRSSSDSRPTTQHTITHEDFPMPPRPSPSASPFPADRAAVQTGPTFPVTFTSEGPRLAESLRITGLDPGAADQRRQSQTRGNISGGGTTSQPAPGAVRSAGSTSRRSGRWSWRVTKAGNPVPTPDIDSTPELHFAIEQLTRDEEIAGYGRDSYIPAATGASSRYSDQLSDRNVPVRTSEGIARVSGTSDAPMINRESRQAQIPPTSTLSPTQESVSHRYSPATPDDYANNMKLHALPQVMKYHWMGGIILLCVFMVTTLVIVSVHSALSGGLNRYDGTGTSLYFVYRYLPQLVAAIIIVWLHMIQDAIQRILPFVLLVPLSKTRRDSDVLQTTRRFKSTYLWPDLSPFKNGETGLGLCNVVFWLALFTVPLASAVFTPTFFTTEDRFFWRWTAVQAVCWTLLPIYFLMIVALIFVAFRFNVRPTTLKWDPGSLADIFVLLRRGNTTFSRYATNTGKFAGYPDTRPASLGLWRSPSNANGFSHGIGVDTQIVGGAYSPPPIRHSINPSDPDSPHPVSHFESWQTQNAGGYPWLPWFLRPSPVALWIAIAIVLLIAFLVVSWVNRAVEVGFNPLLFAGIKTSVSFSSANFLYSFLPALLGMLCYLFWQPFDATYRALQPFASMQKADSERAEGGASAHRSVLTGYNAKAPLMVSIAALRNRHYRVAWLSFVTLLSMTIPVLAGGVFQAQYIVGTVDTISEIASIPGYVALNVFVTIYALSYVVIWPTRAHRLPHDIRTVADVADFVIGGKLLNDIVWKDPPTKAMLVKELSSESKFTGEKKVGSQGNFKFGEHVGLDGKRRQGIFRSE